MTEDLYRVATGISHARIVATCRVLATHLVGQRAAIIGQVAYNQRSAKPQIIHRLEVVAAGAPPSMAAMSQVETPDGPAVAGWIEATPVVIIASGGCNRVSERMLDLLPPIDERGLPLACPVRALLLLAARPHLTSIDIETLAWGLSPRDGQALARSILRSWRLPPPLRRHMTRNLQRAERAGNTWRAAGRAA